MDAAPDQAQILQALQSGELEVQGQFLRGSNYTFLAEARGAETVVQAVYKPVRGEQPLWDFPAGSLAKREAAAFEVSRALGWPFVPPTVFRRDAPLGAGSLQQFIRHRPGEHYFTFDSATRQLLRPVALFDILINNADRKGGHVLRDAGGHLWLIDHGVCFHVEDKLRTVIWDFAGEPIPAGLLADVARLIAALEERGGVYNQLKPLLRAGEIGALTGRARLLLQNPVFPYPGRQRAVPWPPI